MDAVATPKLDWYRCFDTAECTTAKVPRDYDRPNGAKVELALLRVKARDPKNRIGSLFINPGGPGGSATEIAYFSPFILSPKLLDRFDIVGMDPRGVAFSDNVTCLSPRTQDDALDGYRTPFPLGAAQEKAWLASDKALGRACSKDPLAKSMSTAEVSRDMELMRRAVGDPKLTYLGLSYGSYIGQVYANMFPDRFRTIAVDGVLDPVAWASDKSNVSQPLEMRLKSGIGAHKALREILSRCDGVGGAACVFATGDPVANLRLIADRLRANPLVIEDEEFGGTFTFTYQDMVVTMLSMLYDPAGYVVLVQMLADLYVLTEPPATSPRPAGTRYADAARNLAEVRRTTIEEGDRPRWGFPYDNSLDALASVACTDSKENTKSSQFPAYAIEAGNRAPYFGQPWLWFTSVCAGDAFTGNDEDAYTGPFNTKTRAPVLYVGNYYDPATNYDGAVTASRRMPNSRLLTSDSFGHTAYGTSDCTTDAVDAYLLNAALPPAGKVCVGDVQPFAADEEALDDNAVRQQALRQQLNGRALIGR
jgi:pimeloyl-ACP methyl ester carboxylesterase